jgi:hypothetical protein
MPEFYVDRETIAHITKVTAQEVKKINRVMSRTYGENSSAAFCCSIGVALTSVLVSFADSEKGNAVDAVNATLAFLRMPWRLVPMA